MDISNYLKRNISISISILYDLLFPKSVQPPKLTKRVDHSIMNVVIYLTFVNGLYIHFYISGVIVN